MHTKRTATGILRVLAALAILLTGWLGAVRPASAQTTSDIVIYTAIAGYPYNDACYVLVGFSEVGCDANGDGGITFDAVPLGTYTVHQTEDLGDGRYVDDFTITVTGATSGGRESFTAIVHYPGEGSGSGSGGSTSSGSSDIAIVTTENGRSVTDACYVIVDYSDIGCDENGDGKITFEDIPYGTWTIHQTNDLGAGRYVNDFTITVTGAASSDGWERFPATVRRSTGNASGPSGTGAAKDISLITRDPKSGDLLTGTCYIVMDYSEEGCDENSDGQVTFAAIPSGTYTVRQTRTPSGYPKVDDFPITIDDSFPNVAVGYLVKQARAQNGSGTRNVSFIFVDSRTKTKVVPAKVCLKIGDVSEVGCDEDLVDGQIDFLDVETGNHPLIFSNLPNGWQIMGDDRSGQSVTIGAGSGPQIVYIGVYTGGGSGSGGGSTAAGSGTGSGTTDTGNCTASGSKSCKVGGLVLSCNPAAACFGGTITASTQDGTVLGSCTMTGDVDDTSHPYSCGLSFNDPVTRGDTIALTIDGIASGYVAEQNPMYFDTSNVGMASHDAGFTLVLSDGSTSDGDPAR